MGDKTGIAWTDATWNPVTGCEKVSPGCAHCYAEQVALRFWPTQYPPVEYDTYSVDACCPITEMRARQFTDVQCHDDRLDQPIRWKRPRRVFVNSMSDLFHEAVPVAFILDVYRRMGAAYWHTYQVLTKRHDRMQALIPWLSDQLHAEGRTRLSEWRHVWHLVSVENQRWADIRIPALLRCEVAVRGVSYEPALEAVDFVSDGRMYLGGSGNPRGLDWCIVGGESGRSARPFDLTWARSVVKQCREAGVQCFVKQLGSNPTNSAQPDGDLVKAFLTGKADDPAEWPEDLRIRQFPEARTCD